MPQWTLPYIIAHRGASGIAPENTLSALREAAKLGCCAAECDVQLTRDAQAIIMHDATLKRTTNGSGFISRKTGHDIAQLDAGSWFSKDYANERVPTLSDWITCGLQSKLQLNLELKVSNKKQMKSLATIVCDLIAQHYASHDTLPFISSSHRSILLMVKEYDPRLLVGWIVEKRLSDKTLRTLVAEKIVSVHQPYALFSEEYVKRLHSFGLRALAYTVNEFSMATYLKKIGVDGIFSDSLC